MSDTARERRGAVADLAASALLGALLWDPARLRDVADWLQPQDFRRWGDRAVYATLLGLHRDERRIELTQLPKELAAGSYHDAHVERSDGRGPLSAAALHTYLSITPATPRQDDVPVRSEHVQYAQLVLDESIRRQVEALGTRIDQKARDTASHDSATAAEVLVAVLADVQTQVQQLTGRLDAAHRAQSPIAAALDPGTRTPAPPAVPSAHDGVTARAPDANRSVRVAETTLIGAAMVSSGVRELAGDRLRAADFTTPELAATWEAVRSLQDRRSPVDVVLVAAEVERLGELPGLGRGLDPVQLVRLARRVENTPIAGYRALETVVHAALTRTMQRGGEQLHSVLGGQARSSNELLAGAQHTINGVERTVRRLAGTSAAATAAAALTPPAGRIPAARQPQPIDAPPVTTEDPQPGPTLRRR